MAAPEAARHAGPRAGMRMGTDTAEAPAAASRGGKSQAAFRTISEVADELDVAQHVLRFWESKFPQVRPLKRGGGRRYYRPEDIDLLRDIRTLLYDEGYTIKGAQKLLRQRRARPPAAPAAKAPAPPPAPKPAENGLLQPQPDARPAIPPATAAPEPLAAAEEPPPPAAAGETELERLRRLRAVLHAVRHELEALLATEAG